tara:strand:- start:419 stop:751 length:333 start_codon:yes stop_codon:yes gene_type:complete
MVKITRYSYDVTGNLLNKSQRGFNNKKSKGFGQKRPGKATAKMDKRLSEVFEHKRKVQKEKRAKAIRKGLKKMKGVDKALKSKKRTKLGKSVNVNLGRVSRGLGSSTFFN